MSNRRKLESSQSSIGHNDEYRQSAQSLQSSEVSNVTPQTSERKSVFERLGRLPITRTIDSRRGLTRTEIDETDLRIKVRQKRREIVSPTSTSTSVTASISQPISQCVANTLSSVSSKSQSRIHSLSSQSSHKSSAVKTDDNKDNKVKSLVMVKRSPSPTTHPHLLSFSSAKQRSQQTGHKWDDDDDEELERKRLQLQRELQELETNSGNEEQNNASKQEVISQLQPSVEDLRSRSSSTLSESGSYSSTIKSLTKTESSTCSNNNDRNKTSNSATRRDTPKSVTSTDSRHHSVSSSISRSVKYSDNSDKNSELKKPVTTSTGLKLDRHGNVRISLDEQERQKRLRAERFSQKRSSPVDPKRNKTEQQSSSTNYAREHSCSPPAKRARDAVSSEKSISSRHDNQVSHKTRYSDDTKKDDYKPKSDSRSKHDIPYVSRNTEKGDGLKSKLDAKSSVSGKDDRSSHLLVVSNSDKKRDHSRDSSRYSDRDTLSVTSSHDRKRNAYSRDHSPAHSSHSKISRISRVSRASSAISDRSHKSKSDALSNQLQELVIIHSQNSDTKSIEKAEMAPIIDEMSPISADSSIPDVCEIDTIFPSQESETTTTVGECEEKYIAPKRFDDTKNEDESDDNFSDWSEGEDELLLQTDGFETLDEAGNLSETTQEKDLYNDYKLNAVNRRDSSHDAFSPQSKEADDALEAISDDELDAIIGESEPVDSALDSKNTSSRRQMLDALEIDWKSLIREPKTKPEFIPGSARKRFTPANVLMRIGFSQAYAGPLMTQKIIEFCKNECQNELKKEFEPFRHPIASVHALITERIRERRHLFQVDSTHSTALSGRKDLQIRKMLNKPGFKTFDANHFNNNTSCSVESINCNDDYVSPSLNVP